ncbi:flagellar basal-body rod protein FlgG [Clostridium felsineum]|uniref:Flagellar basal-body rod protein FlgG n=1 Tax=Clostridium felsineum TaxID=36839 RepID=A0A1S8MDF6_9CLOT|nr:flagellar basal-body rod protein FlgG [Clostridium felsineum]URZ06353.1 Flagellar basal-body rod protein FlgG [Clostridium felsineum]URZ11388.1 Flagellar basal-body rod protein FlgG [Clostridium felsineum]
MVRGLYTAVTGMVVQEAKQDVISNNLANTNTVGFKSDSLSSQSFEDVLIQNYSKRENGTPTRTILGNLNLGSKINDTATDFSGGNIQTTNSDTDFAIEGRGFFTVRKNNGSDQNYYTRNGHFHVNSEGYLLDDNGDYIMGTNLATNTTEPMNLGKGSVDCDPYGNVSVNGQAKYKFNFVDFNDYTKLKKIGDNLFEGDNPTQNFNASVENKALESSNVNVMKGITDMMTTMRVFESNQKIVQSIDETVGKAVNEVGKV